MGWLDRFRSDASDRNRIEGLERRVAELTAEQRSIDSLPWNVGAESPVRVPSSQTALRLAPVYAAVSMIARSISTLPVHSYRLSGTDQKTRLPRLPQLFQTPSIHGDLTDWLHRLLTSLLLDGNAYGLITARDGYGYPVTIEWLDPRQMYVVDEGQWGRGSYWDPIYYWRGREIEHENLVHIPWFSVPFRVKGLSPLGAFASAVGIGLDGQKFAQDWYKSGGVPPGTFKNAGKKLDNVEAEQVKNRLVTSIRTHEPLVYGADWDYNPIAINPRDLIFIETHQMSANDIAVVYGIYPAERIGGNTGKSMTYSNVEAEQIQWVNITLMPYVLKLESYFFDLLPQPVYVKFNLDSQIRPDTHTRYLNYQIARDIGLNNIDEIRDLEDRPHLPNGQGQDYNPLVAVRELIRSAAASTLNPNQPGFVAGEPGAAPGVGVGPGAAAAPGQPAATQNGSGAPGSQSSPGRFVWQPGELAIVARSGVENDRPPF